MRTPRQPQITPRPPHRSGATANRHGFTVIELIAVMTILAILATAVAASTMARMRRSAREVEVANLANIADALRNYVRVNRTVPAATNWPTLIASQMALPPDRVIRTTAGFNRLFALDPSAQLGVTNNASLPYTQGASGSIEPNNVRIVIVSSLSKALPAFSMTASNFASIWNAPEGSIPIVFTNYYAAVDEFRIQRLDLRELMHRVVLSNLDPANTPLYSIDAVTNATSVALAGPVERWFFNATPVNLHYPDGSMQARDILRGDISYVFENGRWSRYLNYGRRPPLATFATIIEQFRNAPTPASAQGGTSPQDVIQEFMVYLTTYATWSSGGSPFSAGDANVISPTLQALRDSQTRLDTYTTALIPAAQ